MYQQLVEAIRQCTICSAILGGSGFTFPGASHGTHRRRLRHQQAGERLPMLLEALERGMIPCTFPASSPSMGGSSSSPLGEDFHVPLQGEITRFYIERGARGAQLQTKRPFPLVRLLHLPGISREAIFARSRRRRQ